MTVMVVGTVSLAAGAGLSVLVLLGARVVSGEAEIGCLQVLAVSVLLG